MAHINIGSKKNREVFLKIRSVCLTVAAIAAALSFNYDAPPVRGFSNENIEILQTESNYLDFSAPFTDCWKYPSDAAVEEPFASDNALEVYVSSRKGGLESLETTNGRRIWVTNLGGEIISSPAVGESNVFVLVETADGFLVKSVAKTTGITNWQTRLNISLADREKNRLLLANDVLVLACDNGVFYALQTKNGTILWNKTIARKFIAAPFDYGNGLSAVSADGYLLDISVIDGTIKLLQIGESVQISAAASKSAGIFYIGDKKGFVANINVTENRKLWKSAVAGAEISDITITENGLLVSSYDNFIYLVSAKDGRRKWKKRMPGRLLYKPTISGRFALINTPFERSAAIFDLKTGNIVNRVNLEEGNYFTSGFTIAGNRLLAATFKGLIAFGSLLDKC